MIEIDRGVTIGFGGTNARVAGCVEGDIVGFDSIPTPDQPDLFFSWMARQLLDASHKGSHWLVAGFPGPVSPDGQVIGPMGNVQGMNAEQYDLRKQLTNADPEAGRILEQGFKLIAVNDGTLAAHAAASRIGEHKYNKTGALIIGTGVGAGIVEKDPQHDNVHRVDASNPLELGHLIIDTDTLDSFDSRYSGPGIEKRYGMNTKSLPAGHQAWKEVGEAAGTLAMTLGLVNAVDLVVPTGGVGAGASDKLQAPLNDFMNKVRNHGNSTQKLFAPEIMYVDPKEAHIFEMYGGESVIREHLATQSGVSEQ